MNLTDEQKFTIELEFVQCLANPAYLSFLAQRGTFEDPKFIAYLKYLLYLSKPPYIYAFSYAYGLKVLQMLQDEHFRQQLKNPDCISFIHRQQFYEWMGKFNTQPNSSL